MNPSLNQLLSEYKLQFKVDPATADRALLETGRGIVEERLQSQPLDGEFVHLAYDVYFLLDDRRGIVDLMSHYLRQSLPVEEEAWARWEQIDYMAGLSYPQGAEPCREVVEKHKQFLAWARERLSPDRLLWVMYDGTQAVCWRLAGRGEEWLQIFQDIMTLVLPTSENRFDRFLYLRTAAVAYLELGRPEEALQLAQRMHALCEEDPAWERAFEVRVNAYASEINSYYKMENIPEIRHIGRDAAAFLEGYERNASPMTPEQKRCLGVTYDNLGACLFFARQYALAIPLERHAIELGGFIDWTCFRLAAAVWATTKNRAEALELLKQGVAVCRGDGLDLRSQPEFADVANDPEFIDAAKRSSR